MTKLTSKAYPCRSPWPRCLDICFLGQMTKMKSNTRGSRHDEASKVPDQLRISGGIYDRGNKKDGTTNL